MKKGILFVFSGPSGSGKTTLAKEVVKNIENISFTTSYTTRKKRESEIDGKDYHFVNIEKFKEMINNNKFAEWAEVFGNYYGTPLSEVNSFIEAGRDVLLEIDVKGAGQIRQSFKDSVHLFILAPDMKELRQRLEKRKTDSKNEIEHRLSLADKEITQVENYDYIIINEDLENSMKEIKQIIQKERNNIQ